MKPIGIVNVSRPGFEMCRDEIYGLLDEKGISRDQVITTDADFEAIVAAQEENDQERVAELLMVPLRYLESRGARVKVIPANSVHYAFEHLSGVTGLLDMVDATVVECVIEEYRKVGVLGVGITMSGGLYENPLRDYGVETVFPSVEQMASLDRIIYDELVRGEVKEDSVKYVLGLIEGFKQQGCDAVILGCTELPMVVNEINSPLPYIDTTRLIARKAVEHAFDRG